MNKIYMMIGLPRSGKTTYIKENKDKNEVVISADRLRKNIYGQEFYKDGEDYVWAVRKTMLKELLSQGITVWIDETNTTKKRRAKIIETAHKFDYKVEGVVLYTSPSKCYQRNYKKELTKVIDRMYKQWEKPEIEEGFSSMRYIPEKGVAMDILKSLYEKEENMYTKRELMNKLEERGLEHPGMYINLIDVEYSVLNRQGICELENGKMKIPDLKSFIVSIKAFKKACGPYTGIDVHNKGKLEGKWKII